MGCWVRNLIQASKSVVRDVGLIVISILIAFALDAWWADRIQQNELLDALVAVREDFLATSAELEYVLSANRTYVAGVNALVRMDRENVAALANDSAEALVRLLPTGGLTFDPTMGAVDALISGGDLQIIEDVDLRAAIAAWPSVIDELTEDLDILIQMYLAQQERSVQLGIYLRDRRANLADVRGDTARGILRTVMSDEEMLNRLAAHAFAIESLEEELVSARQSLVAILDLLPRDG